MAGMFLECHFWGNGLAAMSTESIVYVAEVYIIYTKFTVFMQRFFAFNVYFILFLII